MRRWLTTLAEHLRAAGTRDWLWWELARQTAPTLRARLALRTVIGLTVGLVVGPMFGLVFGLVFGAFGLLLELAAPPRHVDLRLSGRCRLLRRMWPVRAQGRARRGGRLAGAVGDSALPPPRGRTTKRYAFR
jgi:hypothetical protein